MNQWPVVFLSLKNVDGIHFSDAYQQLVYEISLLYQRHDNLLKSTALSDRDKFLLNSCRNDKPEKRILCVPSVSYAAVGTALWKKSDPAD